MEIRRGLLAAAVASILASGCGGRSEKDFLWYVPAEEHPSRSDIRLLEETVRLNTKWPISEYARFYWISPADEPQVLRSCEHGEVSPEEGPFLRAVYVHKDLGYSPGVHLNSKAPLICDGGCGVIDVAMILKTKEVVEASCHAKG